MQGSSQLRGPFQPSPLRRSIGTNTRSTPLAPGPPSSIRRSPLPSTEEVRAAPCILSTVDRLHLPIRLLEASCFIRHFPARSRRGTGARSQTPQEQQLLDQDPASIVRLSDQTGRRQGRLKVPAPEARTGPVMPCVRRRRTRGEHLCLRAAAPRLRRRPPVGASRGAAHVHARPCFPRYKICSASLGKVDQSYHTPPSTCTSPSSSHSSGPCVYAWPRADC